MKVKSSMFGKQFGKYRGTYYQKKKVNPWCKVWVTQIAYNGANNVLGYFNDPISGEMVYNIVFKEIHNLQ